ncbi:MAG: hypothetical protein KDI98_07910 [Hyphomicrobiaceae bacterium]|nr:hypothetical protein [Hyphomicrobiaceae bacterium]
MNLRMVSLCALVAASVALASPARAQGLGMPTRMPVAEPATLAVAGAPAAPQQVQVDESALRYYASQNQTARVEAEIRRLQMLYPGWQPPSDLHLGMSVNPEQPLWDLLGAGRIQDLRAEVETRLRVDPTWQPPDDLLVALERMERRARLIAASEGGNHGAVVDIVEADPSLIVANDLDVMWRVADSYGALGNREQALALFELAVRSSANFDQRRVSIVKALVHVAPEEARGLLDLARMLPPTPDAASLAALETDLVRAEVGAFLRDPARTPPRAEALAVIEASAEQGRHAGDAALIGWYYRLSGDMMRALPFFELAVEQGGDTDARVGLALVLRDVGWRAEAERIAAAPTEDERLLSVFVELVAHDLLAEPPVPGSPERVQRFAETVRLLQSGDGAEALGWYAYQTAQFEASKAWFEQAMSWQPTATAAEGMIRTLYREGSRDQARQLLAEESRRFPTLAALEGDLAERRPSPQPAARSGGGGGGGDSRVLRAAEAQRAGRSSECLRLLDASGSRSPEASLIRGWCLLDLQRPHEAMAAFEAAGAGPRRISGDAAYGRSLALLRIGQSFAALDAVRGAAVSESQRAEIARAVLADLANRSYQQGQYGEALAALDRRREFAPETRDLSMLRVWALHGMGRTAEARQLVEALDRQLSTSETRRALATFNQISGLTGWR